MFPYKTLAALGLTAIGLLTGCAGAPTVAGAPSAAIGQCSDLQAEIAVIEESKHAALQKQKDAWKAVIPFAVAARYAGGKSAAAEADQRLKELRSGLARQGCGDGRAS